MGNKMLKDLKEVTPLELDEMKEAIAEEYYNGMDNNSTYDFYIDRQLELLDEINMSEIIDIYYNLRIKEK